METESVNRFALLRDHELVLIRFALYTLDNLAGYDEAPILDSLRIALLSEPRGELLQRELDKRIKADKSEEDTTAISGKPTGPRPPITPSKPRKG